MTTPAGVPNLPTGALSLDKLAATLQDMSVDAMRARAEERMPYIFDSSTGGDITSDLSPFGILAHLWAGFNSNVANADPADIQGPEDLPGLLLDFIEALPVIGQFAMLLEAILGTYDGDDETLLAIQAIFAPIRQLLEAVANLDLSSPEAFLTSLVQGILLLPALVAELLDAIVDALVELPDALGRLLDALIPILVGLPDLLGELLDALIPALLALPGLLGDLLGGLVDLLTDLTGVDLTELLPVFEGLDLSDPAAFIASLIAAFNTALGIDLAGIPAISDIVEAITGSTGGLSELSEFFLGIVPLDQLVQSLTGTPGDLPDLESWVGEIPILSDLAAAFTGEEGGLPELAGWSNNVTMSEDFDELVDTLGGAFGDTLIAVNDRLEDFLTPSSDIPGANVVGEIVDDVIPGISTLLENIFSAVSGNPGSGVSHAQAQAALAAQTAALTGVAASVARLNTAFTGGVSAYDDFEFSDSNDLAGNWALAYSSGPGNIYADGHNAAWDTAELTSTPRTVRCRWLGANATSSSDYQRVEVVLNSRPQNPLIGSPAADDILLRMDAGMTNFIRIRFRGDNVVLISRIVGGAETVMNSGSLATPLVASATIGGEAGKLGTARYFKALLNGFPVLAVTEAGTASMVGSPYRGWGFGMFAGSDTELVLIPSQSRPGAIKQWTASDLVI